MKLLVTGAGGQVGRELVELCVSRNIDVIACTREDLDITNVQQVNDVVIKSSPDFIVNAAAYTAVDKAESESKKAWEINCDGTKNLAAICSLKNIPLLHLSTDYVFDGEKSTSYTEADATNPLGVYGQSKLAGELAIREACSQYYILRTSWVFGQYGNNFVKTMLRVAKQGGPLSVVNDQRGTPTSALMIAEAIVAIVEGGFTLPFGVYHVSGQPEVTWYEFACSIVECGVKLKLCERVDISSITSEEYPTPAKRPKNSSLNGERLFGELSEMRPNWHEYLHQMLIQLRDDS